MFGYPAVTHAVYQYLPYSFRSLKRLLEYEVFGEKAKFMRDVAKNTWAQAVHVGLEKEKYRPYTEELYESIYTSPFKKKLETGHDVINYLLGRG